MKIDIHKNLKNSNLLSELCKIINLKNITIEERLNYELIQKICLYDLENEDDIEKHITSFKLNENQLKKLPEFVSETDNIEIKARIHDILQINKKKVYDNSLNSYKFYTQLTEKGDLSENREFFIRSIEVLKVLGKGAIEQAKTVFDKIKQEVLSTTDDWLWYSQNILLHKLYELSLTTKSEFDFSDLINFIKKTTNNYEKKFDFTDMRHGYKTLKIIDKLNYKKYHFLIGKSYENEADKINSKKSSPKFIACNHYETALSIYTDLGNKIEENRVKRKLVETKKDAVSQMEEIVGSIPIPSNSNIQLIIDNAKFNNFEEAIYWLIYFNSFPDKQYFEKKLVKDKENHLCLKFFPSSEQLNSKGNRIGISEDNSKSMFKEAKLIRDNFASNFIIPALQKIQKQFVISYEKISYLLFGSQFIPDSRLQIYVYAIYQGFIGNFLVSTHLLIPQIENSLRYILQKAGKIPTKLNQEIQEEILLSGMLGKFDINNGKLKGVISDDLIFDLQGLLNEPFGDNLRNEVVHGLCEVNKLVGEAGIYLWWLSLKLSLMIDYFIEKE
ncbi:MAG: DUF4209 domain-containing protein [Bacteroidales bacterium]|nr:DUF4209 domain-containing protein [Bacteroidales bacterium]